MFNVQRNDMQVYTAAEVQEILGIGKNTLYRLLQNGEIESFRIGKIYKIPEKALNNYIAKNTGFL